MNADPPGHDARVLVYRTGSIGDMATALPALKSIRAWAGGATVILLCQYASSSRFSIARALVEGSALVDGFVEYGHWDGEFGKARNLVEAARLLTRLRAARLDSVIYLAPAPRPRKALARDRAFFRMAGIRRLIGFSADFRDPGYLANGRVVRVARESEALLARLAAEGIPTEGASPELRLGVHEDDEVAAWLAKREISSGAGWVSIGASSNRPQLVWPEERFLELGRWLWERWRLWPVVVGGREDAEQGRRLIAGWGRGFVAAGDLSVRASARVIERSALFVGNDSGPMHLAASVGRRCVAIFSARNAPGRWEPWGNGHVVLRKTVPCEGCGLNVCMIEGKRCLMEITIAEAQAACDAVLLGQGRTPQPASNAEMAEDRRERSF
ncbi:MAG TPA: glycosyltransferase family 9 protein [Thermoanaerobaculia bacterium]|jgi:ADP-heptose:LPS heptosyltransferase